MNKLIEIFAFGFLGIMLLSIFMGAILYSAEVMQGAESVKEILFWSSLILIFLLQVNRIISDTFTQFKSKAKVKE